MTTLEQLSQLARGIARQFGNSCEVVIHDVRKKGMEGSIVYIENGGISGREVGDGPSHVVLEAIKDGKAGIGPEERYCYLTRTKDGRVLRSSTMYIRDDRGEMAYIFCINFDITDFLTLQNALDRISDKSSHMPIPERQPERITTSVIDLLDDLLEQAEQLAGKPAAAMTKNERLVAIKYLNDSGAFLISKSSDKIAEYFGISKFTLYSDINTVKEPEQTAVTDKTDTTDTTDKTGTRDTPDTTGAIDTTDTIGATDRQNV